MSRPYVPMRPQPPSRASSGQSVYTDARSAHEPAHHPDHHPHHHPEHPLEHEQEHEHASSPTEQNIAGLGAGGYAPRSSALAAFSQYPGHTSPLASLASQTSPSTPSDPAIPHPPSSANNAIALSRLHEDVPSFAPLPSPNASDASHSLGHSVAHSNATASATITATATTSTNAPPAHHPADNPAMPMLPPRMPSGLTGSQRDAAWGDSLASLEQRYPTTTPSGLSLVSHYLPGKSTKIHRLGSRRHRGRSLYDDQKVASVRSPLVRPLSNLVPTSGGAFRRSGVVTPSLTRLSHAQGNNGNPLFQPPDIPAAAALHTRKVGAGRAAWGPDGGGNAALGAGGYEDDDGVDIAHHEGATSTEAGMHRAEGLVRRLTGRRRHTHAHSGQGEQFTPDPIGKHASDEKWTEDEEGPSLNEVSFLHRTFGGLVWRLTGRKDKIQPLRWNKFKWALFAGNLLLTCYGIAALVGTILTWTRVWSKSDNVLVSARVELILSTVAATLFFVSAIVGWCGILLNNRAFLTVWNILLWISLAFLVAPGYIAYKKHTFNLEGKTNELWSRSLGVAEREIIQNTLSCCGYYNPTIEASESNLCYARSALPGCKGRFLRFERMMFRYFYTTSFSLVGPHLCLIVLGLLCSNHVTYRFGKGITPVPYQLDPATARTIKDDFLSQLAQIYSPELVRQVLEVQRRNVVRRQRQVPSINTPGSKHRSLLYLGTPTASGTAAHTMASSIARTPGGHAVPSASLLAVPGTELLPPDRQALFGAGTTDDSDSSVNEPLGRMVPALSR